MDQRTGSGRGRNRDEEQKAKGYQNSFVTAIWHISFVFALLGPDRTMERTRQSQGGSALLHCSEVEPRPIVPVAMISRIQSRVSLKLFGPLD